MSSDGSAVDFSEDREFRQVENGLRVRPAVTYEIIRKEGEEELSRGFRALFWSGLAAGLSISFSMVAMGILQSSLPNTNWAHPIAATGYTAGFIIVILTRQQLFTENTITALLPVMARHSDATWLKMARLWAIVLSANALGAVIFALASAYTPLFSTDYQDAFFKIGEHIFEYDALEMFVKGIAAGWLIAALVWVLPSSQNQKFLVIFFFTWLIGFGEFTHIVAGTTEAVFYLAKGGTTLFDVVFVFMLPTLLGNIAGGSALFALISYAQVKDELEQITAQ